MTLTLQVNGQSRQVDSDPQTPALWVIREELGLART
jgi:isoquinoline 1-oxidoreductase alpha subunit